MHNLRSLMSSRGVRCTRQREGVFAALIASKRHPTAEELHRIANSGESTMPVRAPGTAATRRPGMAHQVSLATVYNTLDALCRAGLVRRLPATNGGVGGGARYEADLSEHLHVILADGRVRDVPEELGRSLLDSVDTGALRQIETRMGVSISRVRIELLVDEAIA